ncbi:MAG: hypothetical protein K1X79_05550 [Oligoflexia bacterium]|nr:hypothetical protein [Oligoflexia bacterium]
MHDSPVVLSRPVSFWLWLERTFPERFARLLGLVCVLCVAGVVASAGFGFWLGQSGLLWVSIALAIFPTYLFLERQNGRTRLRVKDGEVLLGRFGTTTLLNVDQSLPWTAMLEPHLFVTNPVVGQRIEYRIWLDGHSMRLGLLVSLHLEANSAFLGRLSLTLEGIRQILRDDVEYMFHGDKALALRDQGNWDSLSAELTSAARLSFEQQVRGYTPTLKLLDLKPL